MPRRSDDNNKKPKRTYKSRKKIILNETGEDISFTDDGDLQVQAKTRKRVPKKPATTKVSESLPSKKDGEKLAESKQRQPAKNKKEAVSKPKKPSPVSQTRAMAKEREGSTRATPKRPWYDDIDEDLLKYTKYGNGSSITPQRQRGQERAAKRSKLDHREEETPACDKIDTIIKPRSDQRSEPPVDYAMKFEGRQATMVAQRKKNGLKTRVFVIVMSEAEEVPSSSGTLEEESSDTAPDDNMKINWEPIIKDYQNQSAKLGSTGFSKDDWTDIKKISDTFVQQYSGDSKGRKRDEAQVPIFVERLTESFGTEVTRIPATNKSEQISKELRESSRILQESAAIDSSVTLVTNTNHHYKTVERGTCHNQAAPVPEEPVKKRKKEADSRLNGLKHDAPQSRIEQRAPNAFGKSQTTSKRQIKSILKKTSNADAAVISSRYQTRDKEIKLPAKPIQSKPLKALATVSQAAELACKNPGRQFVFDINKSQLITPVITDETGPGSVRTSDKNGKLRIDSRGDASVTNAILDLTMSGTLPVDNQGSQYTTSYFGNATANLEQVQPISKNFVFKRIGSSNCLELVEDSADDDDEHVNGSSGSEIIRNPVSGNPMTKEAIARMMGSSFPVTPKTPRRRDVSLKELTSSTQKVPCHGLFKTPNSRKRMKVADETSEIQAQGDGRAKLSKNKHISSDVAPETDLAESNQIHSKEKEQRRSSRLRDQAAKGVNRNLW